MLLWLTCDLIIEGECILCKPKIYAMIEGLKKLNVSQRLPTEKFDWFLFSWGMEMRSDHLHTISKLLIIKLLSFIGLEALWGASCVFEIIGFSEGVAARIGTMSSYRVS